MATDVKAVTFKNGTNRIAANLHTPQGFDDGMPWAAIVIATPGSSVKEQTGAIYAAKLAEKGFLALVFDPSCQGESQGEPRSLESPFLRIEDIRCAADFLTALPYVDVNRVGLLGICAGGGYAVQAALTDHRFKALGTIVASNIGAAFRQMFPREAMLQMLVDVGKQRTAEAKGESARLDPWIPDSLKDAEAAGITDQDMLDAVHFYRESEWRHEHSNNRIHYTSFGQLLGFDAFHLVPELLIQPLQVIVGGRRGSTGSYEQSQALFEMAPNSDKDFFVVEGAGHYEMYHVPEYVEQATGKLIPFFERELIG